MLPEWCEFNCYCEMPLVPNRILLKIETIKISENEFSFFKGKVSSVQSLSHV